MNISTVNKKLIQEVMHIPIFSALREDQMEKVLATATQRKLKSGTVLFEQGQTAENFFMVHEGQIQLYRLSEEGDEKVIDIVHPGQIFAEAVMFMENMRYPVNAIAIKNSEIIAFENETFRHILRESIDTCFRLMGVMSQRLHIQLNEIDSLSLHNATYRLVHYLLKSIPGNETSRTEITLSYPKSVLASRLSIKPETFSRIMSHLKQKQIIDVQGSQIIIRDISALKQMAGE